MSTHRLTILVFSPIHQDGRVLRQIEFAARSGYDVSVVGWGHLDCERSNITMHSIQKPSFTPMLRIKQVSRMIGGRLTNRLYEQWFWHMPGHKQALHAVIAAQPQLIHANDIMSLPIAIKAAQHTGAKVLFDAHEYSPGQSTNNLKWRTMVIPFVVYILRNYAHLVDAMITTGELIALQYKNEFGLNAEVILNVPAYQPLPFRPVKPDKIRLIHHGAALRNRQIERMIDVMALTDQYFSLDFMLLPNNDGYLDELRAKSSLIAPDRIHFRSPVPPSEIANTINEYDIGIFLLPPINLHYTITLPNKLFEFIMAGLAVAIGPSPAMASIVKQYGLGVVADSFEPEDLASRLNALSPADIDAMKRRALVAAKELNAENEMRKLHAIYARLLTS